MKTWQITRDGGFGPEDLKMLDVVFSAAWHQIKGRHQYVDAEVAKEKLASMIVAMSRIGNLDAEAFKTAAIKAFDHSD